MAIARGGVRHAARYTVGADQDFTLNLFGSVSVSIPEAGHVISAYALGVVIGAPLVTIAAVKMPRSRLLVLLIALIGLATALQYVSRIGLDNIAAHVTQAALDRARAQARYGT